MLLAGQSSITPCGWMMRLLSKPRSRMMILPVSYFWMKYPLSGLSSLNFMVCEYTAALVGTDWGGRLQ